MSEILKNPYKKFYFFLILITLVNLLQAYFTEITLDEAYYYQYARDLDWGYYDHPPMVALVIKISQLFFNGNLGVRFLTVLLFSGNLYSEKTVLLKSFVQDEQFNLSHIISLNTSNDERIYICPEFLSHPSIRPSKYSV